MMTREEFEALVAKHFPAAPPYADIEDCEATRIGHLLHRCCFYASYATASDDLIDIEGSIDSNKFIEVFGDYFRQRIHKEQLQAFNSMGLQLAGRPRIEKTFVIENKEWSEFDGWFYMRHADGENVKPGPSVRHSRASSKRKVFATRSTRSLSSA